MTGLDAADRRGQPSPQMTQTQPIAPPRATEAPRRTGASVEVDHLSRRYGAVDALQDASLRAGPGEMVAVTGRSGSGKSTLLNLIGGLEQPTSGRVLIDGREIWREPGVARHRRELVGFVFQQHHLLADLTARANVEVALIGAGMPRARRRARALELLGRGRPGRTAPSTSRGNSPAASASASRSRARSPTSRACCSPTSRPGRVDSVTSQRVLDLLGELRARRGMTLIVVSYDAQVGERADRMLTVTDGVLTANQ